jgi:hypothetical protein
MWAIFFIAAGFFVAIVAMGYFAVQQGEVERRADRPAPAEAAATAPALGLCWLCDGPLPGRAATSDEVVFEVEHRIDAELRDIVHALHAHPESVGRILNG